MKANEQIKKYSEMTSEKLVAELKDTKKKLASDILKVQAGKLDNYSAINKQKKNIARISTIINGKNLE